MGGCCFKTKSLGLPQDGCEQAPLKEGIGIKEIGRWSGQRTAVWKGKGGDGKCKTQAFRIITAPFNICY